MMTMARSSPSHKSLNPLAPEFIPYIFTKPPQSFIYTPPVFPPPHNPSNNNPFYYFLSSQTPPPPPPLYTDQFLPPPPPLPPQPPLFPVLPKPTNKFSITREMTNTTTATINWASSLRKFTWRRKKSPSSSYDKNKVLVGNSTPAEAYDQYGTSTVGNVKQQHHDHQVTCKRGGGENMRRDGKIERVVKYGESVNKGKRFDVIQLPSHSSFTTVMIRNIPSKYTRQMLLQFLDEHCVSENEKESARINDGETEEVTRVWSAIDFLYMPIDFKSGWNKSYAFVNFTDARAVWKFYDACHNKKWDFFRSSKIREIACAKIQGKEALVEHFGHTAFACDSDEYLPVCFDPPRDGSNRQVVENCFDNDQEVNTANVVGRRISICRH